MVVNERIHKCLASYGGNTINEKIYNYLGSLGYTGSFNDRANKHTYLGYRGYQAIIEETKVVCGVVPPDGLTWDSGQTWDNNTYWS